LANGTEEAIDSIERIFKGRDEKKKARRKFVEQFVRPRGIDVPAGTIVAQVIEMAANGTFVTEINSTFHYVTSDFKK